LFHFTNAFFLILCSLWADAPLFPGKPLRFRTYFRIFVGFAQFSNIYFGYADEKSGKILLKFLNPTFSGIWPQPLTFGGNYAIIVVQWMKREQKG